MKRLAQAPNAVLAVLWADMLRSAGIDASVQRYYSSAIAGEIPPDQSLPEVWVHDASRFDEARELLRVLRRPARGAPWSCPGCGEPIEGYFDQCWNCGAVRP